jgi:hypothetical protein
VILHREFICLLVSLGAAGGNICIGRCIMDRAVPFLRTASATLAALLVVFLLLAALFLPVRTIRAEGGTWPPVGQLAFGAAHDVVIQDGHAYVASEAAMTVFDLSDPSQPRLIGYCDTGDWATAIALSGSYAYIGTSSYIGANYRMYVVDIADPAQPVLLGDCELPMPIRRLAAEGTNVYAADGSGVQIVSAADPAQPVVVGTWPAPPLNPVGDVAVSGAYAYVTVGSHGLHVIDVSNPADLVEVGHLDGGFGSIALAEPYAYVTRGGRLAVIDVSDPRAPVELSASSQLLQTQDVAVSGHYAYIGTSTGMYVYDVADPAAPVEAGMCEIYPQVERVAASGNLVCVAGWDLTIVDASTPTSPLIAGVVSDTANLVDVATAGGYVYTSDSKVVDATDPAHPMFVGTIPWCYRIAISGGRLYTAQVDTSLDVLDLANPAQPVLLGSLDFYTGIPLDLEVSGRYAYTNLDAEYHVADVLDPANPVWVTIAPPGFVSGRFAVAGSHLYADLLKIYDISDPSHPLLVGQCGAITDLVGDLVVAGKYAYVAAGSTGLVIVDVSNPFAPFVTSVCATPGPALDVAVYGGYAYVTAGEAGLRVIDISDPTNPFEVAYWDTPGCAMAVAAENGYVYVADSGWGYLIFPAFAELGALAGQVRARGTTTDLVGATVTAYLGTETVATATAGTFGVYRMENLAPGQYHVVASKPGHLDQVKARITVTAGQTSYVNFWLEVQPTLMGQVTECGTGIALNGATVSALKPGGSVASAIAQTPYGVYQFAPGLLADTYLVCASAPRHVYQEKWGVVVTATGITYVNFNLAVSGKLKGQVTDKITGAPVVGATVVARSGGITWATAVTTAPWGIYEMDTNLPAGTFVVGASKTGYVSFGRNGIVVAAGATTYVNFPLVPQ